MTTEKSALVAFNTLTVNDFYIGDYQELFAVMQGMDPTAIEELTVCFKLRSLGKSGWEDRLAEMMLAGNAAHVESYCAELQRLTRTRAAQTATIQLSKSLRIDADVGIQEALKTLHGLEARADDVKPMDAMRAQFAAELDGTRTALDLPYIGILASTQCFLPGTITLLCGSAGASKSLFTAEVSWRMDAADIRVAKLDLESSIQFHMRRVFAQKAGCAMLTNAAWSRYNAAQVTTLNALWSGPLETLVQKRVLQVPSGGKRMDAPSLLRWISQEADAGTQVCVIDPITMMETDEKSWNDERKFIQGARGIVDRKQIRLLLVTHPKKAGGGKNDKSAISLDNVSGSASFTRFVDSVFWLEAHGLGKKEFETRFAPHTKFVETFNRTMHVLKARLGGGSGRRIAYYMDPTTLCHVERGWL